MIKLTDRFYINATSNCYTLQEKTIIQDEKSKNFGNEKFKDLGYYTTIRGCLDGLLKVTLREYISKDNEKTIKDLKEFIIEQEKFLDSLKLDI